MKRWAASALLLLSLAATPALAAPRVASSGLCADQMLLLLADRRQIASISYQATGPLSHFAREARGLPVNRGAAEEIIASRATVLLHSDGMDKRSAAALAVFGVRTVEVPLVNSWSEIADMTRSLARAIGRPGRGEEVIADMNRRLSRLRPAEPRSQWPTAIYYRPDAGGAGVGTFVNEALQSAGFRNLQAEWGPPLWTGVPVEKVVRQPPDAFVISYFDTSRNSSSVLRRNPVLNRQASGRPVIGVPGKYWNCGSPLLVEAVEYLARHREGIRRKGATNG